VSRPGLEGETSVFKKDIFWILNNIELVPFSSGSGISKKEFIKKVSPTRSVQRPASALFPTGPNLVSRCQKLRIYSSS
jgi:hypothetical protein